MDFLKFKRAVAEQFKSMRMQELFTTGVEKDDLWNTYLSSFPPGTDKIFRQRTEHDCSCCRSFIKTIGNVVTIVDNKLVSIWDKEVDDPVFDVVSKAMSKLVKSKPITNVFLTPNRVAGVDKNFEEILGKVTTWNHFFIEIPNINVCSEKDIGPKFSDCKATHDVFLRSLTDLTDESIDIVSELISQNSIYRGEEHKNTIKEFKKLKKEFSKLSNEQKDLFVWSKIKTVIPSISRVRNTSIGTLLSELSDGMEIEDAVRRFEAMVAPMNYKRSNAIVTKAMITSAKNKIAELGLTSALERRHANISDLNINNILFINRSTNKAVVSDDIFDQLPVKTNVKSFKKVEEIPIEKFIKDIVPKSESIEIMFENTLINNLVSLVAPVNPTNSHLFKWDNDFSWAYKGDVTDSIKERVKKAGGNVTGDLCCRLAWFNLDDLDFHMLEPGGNEIFFRNKLSQWTGGRLDVDMNAGVGTTRTPVENIFYGSKEKMKKGLYILYVHQYNKRENDNVGFEAEIDYLGEIYNFAYDKPVRQDERITIAEMEYSKEGLKITKSLPYSGITKEVWGLTTGDFQKVNSLMLSPNYWDGQGVGNKHYFFMIENCKNDEKIRGFYNEFLNNDLNPHRKVIDLIGNQVKIPETDNQLSGLGFSSTVHKEILVRVTGSFTRVMKVVI